MIPKQIFKGEMDLVKNHILSLPSESRRLRFGYIPNDETITNYVTKSFDDDSSYWYGYIIGGKCIGAVHLCIDQDGVCEIGLSISPEHRGKKLATSLFERALVCTKARKVTTLTMQCLSENKAMQHLAKKYNMKMITASGEKIATVSIDCGDEFVSTMQNLNFEMLALVDSSIRNQVWLFGRLKTIFGPKGMLG